MRERGKPWSLHHIPTDRAEQVDLAAREPATLGRPSEAWEAELASHIRLAMPGAEKPSSATPR